MSTVIVIIISIIAIGFIASRIDTKKIKTPNSLTRRKSSDLWGNAFFDRNRWLKWILLSLLKTIVALFFALLRLAVGAGKMVWDARPKKIKSL
jgi:hypothetical protein